MSTRPLPPPCAPKVAENIGLAGLTIFPIPKTNIAATVHRYAQERYRQLEEGTSEEETLIFIGATTAHVHAINQAGKLPGRITFFGDDQGLLFFRMPRPIHERLHIRLFLEIWEWVLKMGLKKHCRPIGASMYEAFGNRKKEGDSGVLPDPPRGYGSTCSFPTLVIETGNSQSYPGLLKDKDWWFDNSPPGMPEGDVKVVIIVKVYSSGRILLEQWYRNHESASQRVIVEPNPETAFSLAIQDWQTHWVVEGAPFKIEFEDVFLRPKKKNEYDLILGEQDLAELAISCLQAGVKP